MTAKSNVRRRGPSASVSDAILVEPVCFPINVPKPAQTAPEDCFAVVLNAAPDSIRVKLLPEASAVRKLLDDTYGNGGWGDRCYRADKKLRCQIGVYCPATRETVYKEAGSLSIPARDPDQMQEITSFLAAAALWGAGSDVMSLKPILLKSSQVPIVQDDKQRCRLGTALRVDRFARDDAGRITMVQFETAEGKKILWPDAT